MGVDDIPAEYRTADLFSHIDMGFLNRRLAMTALGTLRQEFINRQLPGDDHMTRLRNASASQACLLPQV